MSVETDKVRVPLWMIIVLGIALVSAVLLYLYCEVDATNLKAIGFVGGILTGLIVYLATFITLLRPLQEYDKYRRMGVKGLLANRHDQNYYRHLVVRAEHRVDVMGASCTRFVQDFLDVESEDKVLVDALNRHNDLRVRLMIPDDDNMSGEAQGRVRSMLDKIEAVRKRFGDRVELRRFAAHAHHSFVVVDDDVVAGTIFFEDKSRYAPAVHVSAETMFGQKHCRHFEETWTAARAAS